jgi:hypothetical protein
MYLTDYTGTAPYTEPGGTYMYRNSDPVRGWDNLSAGPACAICGSSRSVEVHWAVPAPSCAFKGEHHAFVEDTSEDDLPWCDFCGGEGHTTIAHDR